MPSPSSATSIATIAAPSRRAVTVTAPPGGECPIALPIRLSSAWRSRSGSPSTTRPALVPRETTQRAAASARRLGGIDARAVRRSSRSDRSDAVGGSASRRSMLAAAAARKLEQPRLREPRPRRIGRRRSRRAPPPGSASRARARRDRRSSSAHPARSPIRSSAQAAVSASIGSSLSTHASASGSVVRSARVAERGERVPAQPARIVARDVEAVDLVDELRPVAREPVERARRSASRRPAAAGRRGASRSPRFHGQTSWQMSQP